LKVSANIKIGMQCFEISGGKCPPLVTRLLRIYVSTNGLGGGIQTDCVSGRGKPHARQCLTRMWLF